MRREKVGTCGDKQDYPKGQDHHFSCGAFHGSPMDVRGCESLHPLNCNNNQWRVEERPKFLARDSVSALVEML